MIAVASQTDADKSNSHQGDYKCTAIDHSCISPSIPQTEYTSPEKASFSQDVSPSKTTSSNEDNTYLPYS